MDRLTGKKAVVVGGSGGIGAFVSRMLLQEGANVVVHGGHSLEKLHQLECREDWSGQITSVLQEITVENFSRLPETTLFKEIRHCSVLCIFFGPFMQVSLEEMTVTDWMAQSLLNYALPGVCISAALPYMRQQHWGRIILAGGTRTHQINGFFTNAAYAGAKTGTSSLVKSVAAAYGTGGITCNGICPGFTDTEYQSAETKRSLAHKMPSGTLIRPETIADAVRMLLLSPDFNGVLLNVDGGWQP